MGAVIESAVNWAVKIANDNSHGYDRNSRRGPNYDCSSLVISAFEQAGCKVKSGGATYTGNMKSVFLRYGFSDVTGKIALSTGLGLKRGDYCLTHRATPHLLLRTAAKQSSMPQSMKKVNPQAASRAIRPAERYTQEDITIIRGMWCSAITKVHRHLQRHL